MNVFEELVELLAKALHGRFDVGLTRSSWTDMPENIRDIWRDEADRLLDTVKAEGYRIVGPEEAS